MQSFGAFFNDNKVAEAVAVVLGLILLIAILTILYQRMFGRRLRMASGGRPRQPRLGVVDAFDLDRQRQLVLVRRDNVEHLIMIGGPNDLVVEAAILRSQPGLPLQAARDGNGPLIPAPLAPAAGQAPTVAAVQTGAPAIQSLGPAAPAAAPALVTEAPALPAAFKSDLPPPPPAEPDLPQNRAETPRPAAQPTPPLPAEADAREMAPPPTRPAPPPLRTPAPYTPRTPAAPAAGGASNPAAPIRTPLSSFRTPPVGSPLPPRPTPTLSRPTPLSPLSRGTSAASLRREPQAPVPPAATPETPAEPRPVPAPDPEAPGTGANVGTGASTPVPRDGGAPRPPALPPSDRLGPPPGGRDPLSPVPSLPTTLDTLESLEEEMAKLLGRPSPARSEPKE